MRSSLLQLLERYKKWLYIVLALAVLAMIIKEAMQFGDFKCYLEAARLAVSGNNPYKDWIFLHDTNYCLYFYSPLWAVALAPFAYMPQFIPNFIWLVANVFFLFRTWRLLGKFTHSHALPKAQFNWVIFLSVLMSIRFIQLNIGMLQMTIFLVWGSLESMRWLNQGRVLAGGFLLALIINIKILPIVFIPYLLYRGSYKGLLSTMGFSALFLLLPAVAVGWDQNLELLAGWWARINPFQDSHLIESELGPHSLTALIPTLLSASEGALPLHRNIMDLGTGQAIVILQIVRVLLIVMTLYFLKWPPFAQARSSFHQLRELGYIMLLVPLIFPHQQKYAFTFIIPASYYVCHYLVFNFMTRPVVVKKWKWVLIVVLTVLSFALMTLTSDALLGRNLNNITQHYKTITWGALLLVGVLTLASPGDISGAQALHTSRKATR